MVYWNISNLSKYNVYMHINTYIHLITWNRLHRKSYCIHILFQGQWKKAHFVILYKPKMKLSPFCSFAFITHKQTQNVHYGKIWNEGRCSKWQVLLSKSFKIHSPPLIQGLIRSTFPKHGNTLESCVEVF